MDGAIALISLLTIAVLLFVFGLIAPLSEAVVLTWWLGAYALDLGVSLVVLAFRLQARLDKHKHGSPA